MRRIHLWRIPVLATEAGTARYREHVQQVPGVQVIHSTCCCRPPALDEVLVCHAMPLQVKAVLESYVRVPALCFSACSAMLGFTGLPSPIFISTSTSPSLRLASPLSSPSHLLPSSFSSPQRRLPVLGSSGPAHFLRALQVNPFFFLSLPTPRTVICHILERLLPIEKRSYSSRQACRILTASFVPANQKPSLRHRGHGFVELLKGQQRRKRVTRPPPLFLLHHCLRRGPVPCAQSIS